MALKLLPAIRLIRGGGAVVRAKVSGTSFPFSMTFILTNRCNFRCSYCDIPASAADEMSTGEFKGALTELADRGLVRASFSGGEALIRKDALEIIAHAKSLGLVTSLNSNGWFTAGHMDELSSVLDLLVISVDGPERVHDLVRRQKRSYERVLTTLGEAKKRGLSCATITVLNRENLHVMQDVLALAGEYNSYAYFQPAYESCFDHRDGFDPTFDTQLFEQVASELRRARAAGARVAASPGYISRLANGPVFGDCAQCSAGRFWGSVLPDGRLVPCHLQMSSANREWPNGRELGFVTAFDRLHEEKQGPGCAISPYQETDLIFGFDPRAILAASQRLLAAGSAPADT